jgi:hypothetical protein
MAFEVTVDVLRRLLWARGVPTVAGDEELVEASRDPQHKLAVTLLSAFAAAGRTLTAEQDVELGHHRDRIERYRAAWKEIHAVAPNAYRVKGDEIAKFYPDGVLRPSSDLDVVIRDPAQLWAAAQRMVELGWEIGALTVVENRDGGDPDILLECQIRGDHEEIFGVYFGVELRTVDIPTSVRQPAYRVPDPQGSPLAANTIALLAERWERQFTSRDRLDLALLVARYTEADQKALVQALIQTEMWPEWRELSHEIGRLGWLPPLPVLRAAEQQYKTPTRTRRIAHGVRLWAHPLRAAAYLAQATIDTDRGKLADAMASFVGNRIGAQRVFGLGVPVFGVPLPDPPGEPPDKLGLVRRGRHLVATTPLGEFLLVTGSCQEEWIEEAQAR